MPVLSRYTLLVVLIANSFGAEAQSPKLSGSAYHNSPSPTPISGESWLKHLNQAFNDSSMGRTGELVPGTDEEQSTAGTLNVDLPTSAATLSGSDLYRLNCRGCHGAQGQGAPPEINSVINPVRATSASLVVERMRSRGLDISPSAANELAQQARSALLKRLHEGGEKMPSFSYLTDAEEASIIAYLKQLADMPGAAREQRPINESPGRIGELIVKSTCHICHDATGLNPTPQQLFDGAIPPLESLTSRADQAAFIRKVTHGNQVVMGQDPMLYRGRMPVFYYLNPKEAADAYLYLSYYPPTQRAKRAPAISLSAEPPAGRGDGGPSDGGGIVQPSSHEGVEANSGMPKGLIVLIAGLFCFVFILLAGGLAFTVREFSRMSPRTMKPELPAPSIDSERQQTTSLSKPALGRYRVSKPAHTISHG